jgi:hypothetical protein
VTKGIPTLIESAPSKRGQVAREGLGLSGRRRQRARATGETTAQARAELGQGKCTSQKAE